MQIAELLRPPLLALAVLLSGPGAALAEPTVTARLDPVAGSGVSGSATLTARDGATVAALEVIGLPPGVSAGGAVHAGSCDRPSASFAGLPPLRSDAAGRALATGPVLFHGTEVVALTTLADGEHIVAIALPDRVVACGSIPGLAGGSAQVQLPRAGGGAHPTFAGPLAALGLFAASAGWFLRRRLH